MARIGPLIHPRPFSVNEIVLHFRGFPSTRRSRRRENEKRKSRKSDSGLTFLPLNTT